MNTTVVADAKFLRRVLLALVMLTTLAGGMAAFTTARATVPLVVDTNPPN